MDYGKGGMQKGLKLFQKMTKRQITAVFGCSMAGDFLPPQLIYQGKTEVGMPTSVIHFRMIGMQHQHLVTGQMKTH